MNSIYILLLIVSILTLETVKAQTINLGDFPQNRMAISGWKDIKFDNSGSWTTVDVTTKGVVPNTAADMAPAINQMITNGSGKTIYKFPAGTYKINTSVTINKNDVQIVGEGSSTKFLLIGGESTPTISVSGKKISNIDLSAPIKRGDNTIQVISSSGVEVGDFLFIAQVNGERSFDIDDQIVKITTINGNILSLDMKMGLPFGQDVIRWLQL